MFRRVLDATKPVQRLIEPASLWRLSCMADERKLPILARLLYGLNFALYNNVLHHKVRVGKDVRLAHCAIGTVIHAQTTIGARCTIHQMVTIAAENPLGSPHRIIIGDDVFIGPHAIILGTPGRSLKIGNRAVIGAGAVVARDLPEAAVVAAVPARIVRSADGPHADVPGAGSSP